MYFVLVMFCKKMHNCLRRAALLLWMAVCLAPLAAWADRDTTATVASDCGRYYWGVADDTLHSSGVYWDTVVSGTDTHYYQLTLTIYPTKDTTLVRNVCDSMPWISGTYTVSGTYVDSLKTTNNCDSIVRLILTISRTKKTIVTDTVCRGSVYGRFGFYVNTASLPGNYTQTNYLRCAQPPRCDSISTLRLFIREHSTDTVSISSCTPYTWHLVGLDSSVVTRGPIAVDSSISAVIRNVVQCDSTVVLNFTRLYPTGSYWTDTACDAYLWHGDSYLVDSTLRDTLTNVVGCDSVVHLNIHIKRSTEGDTSATACDSYSWHGVDYTASATIDTFHYINAVGCDSAVLFYLTVHYSTCSTKTIDACERYTWRNVIYTTSGTYSYDTLNADGCRHTNILQLRIHHNDTADVHDTVMGCYVWDNGDITYSDTIYLYEDVDVHGCDSMSWIHVHIVYPDNFYPPEIVLYGHVLMVNHNPRYANAGRVDYWGYRWYRDGQEIIGAIEDYLPLSRTTSRYYVMVPTSPMLNIWIPSNTINMAGIATPQDDAMLQLSPNPVTCGGTVTLSWADDDMAISPVYIDVYDLQGKKTNCYRADTSSLTISAPEVPGVYLLRVFTMDGKSAVRKLVVK